jgi:accessory gene regulator protein AgrB
MGLASKYIPYNELINICVFSIVFIIALVRAPVEHKNRPLNNIQKIRFKYIAIISIIIMFCTQSLFLEYVKNSIIYGILLSGIIALPIFNTKNVDKS